MKNKKSFEEEKMEVFEFFYKYQNEITFLDIESIFMTLDYEFFKKLESYVEYEREFNFPIDEFEKEKNEK